MDKKHDIQHIDIEFGVVILAVPDGGKPRIHGGESRISGGFGSMCPWSKTKRLEAYRLMRSWLDDTIEGMEEK